MWTFKGFMMCFCLQVQVNEYEQIFGSCYKCVTCFAADLTIVEEASELIERVTKQTAPLPQFTSCCPAWVKYVETYYPEMIPNLSTAKSPIGMKGPTIKTFFAKKKGIDPNSIVNVALTPCTAKKFEIRRGEMNAAARYHGIEDMRDMDYVITTRELAKWAKEEGIDFTELEDSEYDDFMGDASGAAIIFGNTGGVMEAALRTAYEYITKEKSPEQLFNLTPVRGYEGVKEAMKAGVLVGYPVVDVKVALVDGSYHDVDSSEAAFHIAGSMAFKEACRQGGAVLLEPIMKVEITVPEEYMGDVIGDVNSRRGRLEGMDTNNGTTEIHSVIPLSEMFGYATDLRSKTQGRGTYSMEPSHYEEVPKSVLDTIVSSRTKKED